MRAAHVFGAGGGFGAAIPRRFVSDDITEAAHRIASLPQQVSINALDLMPVSQSFAPTRSLQADGMTPVETP